MSPWNPWASLTTSHYSIAVGNRANYGLHRAKLTCRTPQRAVETNQIATFRAFQRFQDVWNLSFKYRLAGWLSIALQGRFARFFAALDLVQSFQSPVGPKGTSLALRVFPHLCRAFVRQGVCVLLLRHPLTVPLRRCETIDMETSLPTILQCAPLPTLQCDSRNYYSKLLAQGPEHNKKVKKHKK